MSKSEQKRVAVQTPPERPSDYWERRAAKFEAVLEEVLSIAEDRADICDGKDGLAAPDAWMQVQQMIERVL